MESYILGLDVGVTSVGWARVAVDAEGRPCSLLDAGVRLVDSAVDGDYAAGKYETNASVRRLARQGRRNRWRRWRRRRKLLAILQRADLLPQCALDAYAIDGMLSELDGSNRARRPRVGPQVLPYALRAAALDERLERHELGRAIYHLAQRRGFRSGRNAPTDDDDGAVKSGICDLRDAMAASGARTLGEHLLKIDPEGPEGRIRDRWTARDMYADEFDKVWDSQSRFHELAAELRERVRGAMFYQRPLKSQRGAVGECTLMPRRRRARAARRQFQRFRLLQAVNNLATVQSSGSRRPLARGERERLIDALDSGGDMTFAAVRKLLGLPKDASFNLEEGGEKRIPGNRTDAKLSKVFGGRWASLDEGQRDQVVEDILSFENDDALLRRARRAWGLSEEAAAALVSLRLEMSYCPLSIRAMERLLPRLRAGEAYATAVAAEFPSEPGEPVDFLPPVLGFRPSLTANQTVCGVVSAVRKVVNCLVRKHGKPAAVRVELARELKQPKRVRMDITARNRRREEARRNAAEKLAAYCPSPSRDDIEKVMLAEECNWTCPYSGRPISIQQLVGPEPQVEVEHILPAKLSVDDSFANKTLAFEGPNRREKRDMTPIMAYGSDPERWREILARVGAFRGDYAAGKLRRFKEAEVPADFASRQLNDTRHASRFAAEYVGLLYGGAVDASGKQRVQVSAGGATAILRREWHIHKNRNDHRHHAGDAIVVALTGPPEVRAIERAAARGLPLRRLSIPYPWSGFDGDFQRVMGSVVVSCPTTRKVNGILHAETNYSPPKADGSHHVRKALHKLTPREMDAIVDPVVRSLVVSRYKEIVRESGGKALGPTAAFADKGNHPYHTAKDGRRIPIHKARVKARAEPRPIADGARKRYVASKGGSNHHAAIHSRPGGRWKINAVSRLDAMERMRRGEPVVARDATFKFSLSVGDSVLMDDGAGREQLFRVRGVSGREIALWPHTEAGPKKDASGVVRASGELLRQRRARKVTVTPSGEVSPAND
jgi:CRISPR-associated endonuclease Csn1